jgi:putative thiamine transport system permease protein
VNEGGGSGADRVSHHPLLRLAPRLTLALMAGPVLAGLAGTVMPAVFARPGTAPFPELAAWPGLFAAARLSVTTGVAATLLSLVLTLTIVAALHGTAGFRLIQRLLTPLLSVPHAAAALGLAFLIAPSGWLVRLLSPWATGLTAPPDILILNDPAGIALTLGLVSKEVPFLLLMTLTGLSQTDADRRMMLAGSLGYGRISGFFLAVMPALYRLLRLPVYAVLAYSMTAVEMAMILGPTLPPSLSAQIVLWMADADLSHRGLAAAGALVQLMLVLATLALWRASEIAARALACRLAEAGWRAPSLDLPAGVLARIAAVLIGGGLIAGLGGMAVWSFAGLWPFPDALPETVSLRTWVTALPDLTMTAGKTMAIALMSTSVALCLVLACLEAEHRLSLQSSTGALWLLYLPLIMPQVAFLPGLHDFTLRAGATGTVMAVAAAHLVFVLPYVFLSLAPAFRAWDARYTTIGASLGAGGNQIFWRLRLPMLLTPILTAVAIGIAVSVGQYLPTLLIGGGRVETLTTAAVALSSGGNRRIIGAYALLQMILPAIGFALALVVPALVWRHRRGMRGLA